MSDDLTKVIPQRVTMVVRVTPLVKNEATGEMDEGETVHETVVVRHLRMGDLQPTFQALAPIAHLLKDIRDKKTSTIDPAALFMTHTTDVMQLIAVVLHKHVDWVKTVDPDDCIDLLTKLLEVNLDFFIQRVLPGIVKLTSYAKAVVQSMPGATAGQTPSKPSSEPDTAITSL